jgi:hypothetical protein
MNGKHFETATLGANAARDLFAFGFKHGTPVRVEKRQEGSAKDALFVIFEDGHETEVPPYTGDTIPRMLAIANLSWNEDPDRQQTLTPGYVESHRDSTGAVLGPEDEARVAATVAADKKKAQMRAEKPYLGLPPNPSDTCELHHTAWDEKRARVHAWEKKWGTKWYP